jgi:hypothetical protein
MDERDTKSRLSLTTMRTALFLFDTTHFALLFALGLSQLCQNTFFNTDHENWAGLLNTKTKWRVLMNKWAMQRRGFVFSTCELLRLNGIWHQGGLLDIPCLRTLFRWNLEREVCFTMVDSK